ncbi:UNVERIFIED_CONTAM: hypothetical protein GTU68_046194 [Idotea baltica]|nr:hypothetical protein [Idotea baltica]
MKRCEAAIGYEFRDVAILRRSLTHSSSATTRLDCNERLEFLGDAVLGLVICEYLFERFPDRREGQLTQQKSHLVSRAVCTDVGERLQLHEFIFVGKGLTAIPDSLKAAVVESIIAAIYRDGGLAEARDFILRAFAIELEDGGDAEADNYKSLLQEETQKYGNLVPRYQILNERGPDHAREFQVSVEVGDEKFVGDWGRSKKLAEQNAAMLALHRFEVPNGSTSTLRHDSAADDPDPEEFGSGVIDCDFEDV